MTTAAAEPRAAAGARDLPAAPYRGIEPFRYADRHIFFAREEETRRLLRYVAVYRGVLFYGDSGSGKSSLVNASFIPAVMGEGFTPDRLRVQPRPGEEIVVERISRSPEGGPPFLLSNFIEEGEAATRVVIPAATLRERLGALPPSRRPLLLFDQFEEFTTLFEAAPRGEAARHAQEAQGAILKAVVELLRDPSLPVKLLFIFREDYLAKLNKLIALFPDLSDQYMRLTPPTTSALHKIIRGSFEEHPGHFGKELSEGLARRLAAEIEERSEGDRLNLSEVQIACLQLWNSDEPDELFEQRGVQGLLEDYLSQSLHALPPNLRDPAVALLGHMVTASGARNVIETQDLISLAHNDEGIPRERLAQALEALEKETKLVRRELRRNTFFYEIVSEFLVSWIRGQKEQRLANIERRKKLKVVVLSVSISLMVALAVIVVAYLILRQRQQRALRDEMVRQLTAERDTLQQEKAAALRALEEANGEKDGLNQRLAEQEANTQAAIEKAKSEVLLEAAVNPGPIPDWPYEDSQVFTVIYPPGIFDEGDFKSKLRGLGFEFSRSRRIGQGASINTILYGRNIDTDAKFEKVKQVAYYLIKSGVKIRLIGESRRRDSTIQITAWAGAERNEILTVDKIRGFHLSNN